MREHEIDADFADAADIVGEIVSKESGKRDRGEKFEEYDASGVREYWLIDPRRNDAPSIASTPAGSLNVPTSIRAANMSRHSCPV